MGQREVSGHLGRRTGRQWPLGESTPRSVGKASFRSMRRSHQSGTTPTPREGRVLRQLQLPPPASIPCAWPRRTRRLHPWSIRARPDSRPCPSSFRVPTRRPQGEDTTRCDRQERFHLGPSTSNRRDHQPGTWPRRQIRLLSSTHERVTRCLLIGANGSTHANGSRCRGPSVGRVVRFLAAHPPAIFSDRP